MRTLDFLSCTLLIACTVSWPAATNAHNATAPSNSSEASPPAPATLVLQPPNNTAQVCGPTAFHKLTKHYRSCAKAFFRRKNPDADCCEGLSLYYGSNTTLPSRHCLCDSAEWTALADSEYSFSTALKMCAHMGYIVPWNEAEGEGYCYGVPIDAETLASANVEHSPPSPTATVKEYFKKLNKDHMIAFAFATSILSGIGVLLVLWVLAWETGQSIKGAVNGKTKTEVW